MLAAWPASLGRCASPGSAPRLEEATLDRFVVGTGRCGSTLLSTMLGEHPEVLSVFELLNGLDVTRRFDAVPVPGEAVAELLAADQPFIDAVVARGYRPPEVTYPFERGRYRRGAPMPWVLVSCLPRFGDDPDALFDEVLEFCRKLPPRSMADHYRSLFAWLGERLGRPHFVERSGSSIEYLGELRKAFPDARFVHLHRSGPEVALSMHAFPAYRLPVALLYADDLGIERPALEEFHRPPRPDDRISRILAEPPPPEIFGRYWNDQIQRGLDGARGLGPDRLLEVRFEDLVRRPAEELRRIAEFFELPEPRGPWLERAAARVRGVPPLRFPDLAPDTRAGLLAACRPAMERLGQEIPGAG